jgi:hypothetical protein
MLTAKVEFIGAIQHANGLSWQHFRCPDSTVSEIIGPGRPRPVPEPTLLERHPSGMTGCTVPDSPLSNSMPVAMNYFASRRVTIKDTYGHGEG